MFVFSGNFKFETGLLEVFHISLSDYKKLEAIIRNFPLAVVVVVVLYIYIL